MNVVQLEAFESSLKGKNICWFMNPNQGVHYPPGLQEQIFTESPPFQRRILVTTQASSEAWKLVDRWDIIYCIQSPQDWSLLLTLILYQQAPEHTLVVFSPSAKPPTTFFQKIPKAKHGLFVCLEYLQNTQFQITFDAVFFPGSQYIDDSSIDTMQNIIKQLLPPEVTRELTLRESIRDLRSAGAGLVISSIESVRRIYTLYWYYASESKQDSLINQIITTLAKRSNF